MSTFSDAAELRQKTMTAVGLRHATGGIELLEEFECGVPALQPRDILVRIAACAMNPIDVKLRTNRGQPGPLEQPKIFGFDGAGVVEAIGTDARLFAVGDKVYFAGSVDRNGTNAELVAVDERIVAKVPKSISLTDAASIPLTALTAHESLFESAGFEPAGKFGQHYLTRGKTLLVLPGAGGVGSMVIQQAKGLTQLFVIATASRQESMDACREFGADLVINHSKPLMPQLVAANLGPNSIDYIINGHDITERFDEYIEILKPFGRIVEIAPVKKDLPMYKMQQKRLSYVWEFIFTRVLYDIDMDKHGVILDLIADFVDSGKVRPSARHVLPWSVDSFRKAHAMQESGAMIGKIVVTREVITREDEAECKAATSES